MPIKQKYNIPDDYDGEVSEWVTCVMCIPNTRKWRGVVSGAIYNLSRGRFWNETTGIISDAQSVGERIYNSMAIDCNNAFGRIADSLESLDQKTPELYTLEEMLDNLGDSTLTDLVDLTRLLSWVGDVFPNIPGLSLPVSDWVSMYFVMRRHKDLMLQLSAHNMSMRVLAAAETGETGVEIVDEITDDIWSGIDSIITTAGSLGEVATGLGTIAALFMGNDPVYPSVDPDNDITLRSSVNLTSKIETAITNNIQLDVCCFNPDQYEEVDSEGIEQPAPSVAPDGWGGSFNEYLAYKCESANFLVDSYITWLDNTFGVVPFLEQSFNGMLNTYSAVLPDPWSTKSVVSSITSTFYWLVENVSDFANFGTLLSSYVGAIESSKDDVVCALYSALDGDEARANLIDVLEDIAPTPYPDGFVSFQVSNLFTNTVLDVLFSEYSSAVGYIGDVECGTECSGASCPYSMAWGTGDLESGGVLSSQYDASDSTYKIYFYLPADMNITLSNLVGFTEKTSAYDSFRFYQFDSVPTSCTDMVEEYGSDTNPMPYTEDLAHVKIFSATSFTLTLSYN